ncbi:efflux RND transporter permease subunit [Marinomonas sp. GJ51-6]|uniref:efflux RND transporter permease subunit n=1 Tax=Marinomonas sp. GJ51-6 TaxID=2992802 RepID=UPI00293447B6|nr:efflux RND transporter permease subunit [Marinomonas sp. GJ51-6]WOD09356.1 efflux RND transporter permease subunit [Marinomonas sp. GJ51-6]
MLKTKEDILNLPIKAEGDQVVLLGDIATGELTFEDPSSYARVEGKRSITLAVSKRVGENIIETIEAVKAVIASESEQWPENLEYNLTGDKSTDIETSLNDLFNNVLAATLLVMIVIVWDFSVFAVLYWSVWRFQVLFYQVFCCWTCKATPSIWLSCLP